MLLVKPSLPEVVVGGKTFINKPINLARCTNTVSSNFTLGTRTYPAIKFYGCEVVWVFNTDDEREIELNRIRKLKV